MFRQYGGSPPPVLVHYVIYGYSSPVLSPLSYLYGGKDSDFFLFLLVIGYCFFPTEFVIHLKIFVKVIYCGLSVSG